MNARACLRTLYFLMCSWAFFGTRFVTVAGPSGALVQVPPGAPGSIPLPAQSSVIAAASGDNHFLALRSDHTVFGWGDNSVGQLNIPSTIQGNVRSIAGGGRQSAAIMLDGTLAVWGGNNAVQITNIPSLAQSGILSVAVGGTHIVALRSDGTVVAWGNNVSKQTAVPRTATNDVVSVAAGSYHSVALNSSGSVIAWGANDAGQTSVPAGARSGVVSIAAAGNFTLALKSDGSVVAWGDNSAGQSMLPAETRSGIVAIAASPTEGAALKSDGSLVVWGANRSIPSILQVPILGIYSGSQSILALFVPAVPAPPVITPSGIFWVGDATGFDVKADIYEPDYQWSKNGVPIPGATNSGLNLGRFAVGLEGSYSVVVHNIAGITTNPVPAVLQYQPQWGQVVSVESNPSSHLSLVPVAARSQVVSVAVGDQHAVALKADGSLVTWASNEGLPKFLAVPAQINGRVKAVAAGASHTAALLTDGSVVSWGAGSTNDPMSAVEGGQSLVPAEAQSGVVAIAAGRAHNAALKRDGTVLTWGRHPAISADRQGGYRAIAAGANFTLGLKTNGSVVLLTQPIQDSLKVPEVATHGINAIAAGSAHALALTETGGVIAWGFSSAGATVVPIKAMTNVVAIAAAEGRSAALLNTGEIVLWGSVSKSRLSPDPTQAKATAVAMGFFDTLAVLGRANPLVIKTRSTDVELSWPAVPTNVGLQSTSDLSPPFHWTPVPDLPVEANGTRTAIIPLSSPLRLFRLVGPENP